MVDIVFGINPLLYRSPKQEVITEYRISLTSTTRVEV